MKKTGKLVAIVLAIGLIIGMIISNTTSANDIITVTAGGGEQGNESEVAVNSTVYLNLKASFKRIANLHVKFDKEFLEYDTKSSDYATLSESGDFNFILFDSILSLLYSTPNISTVDFPDFKFLYSSLVI